MGRIIEIKQDFISKFEDGNHSTAYLQTMTG